MVGHPGSTPGLRDWGHKQFKGGTKTLILLIRDRGVKNKGFHRKIPRIFG